MKRELLTRRAARRGAKPASQPSVTDAVRQLMQALGIDPRGELANTPTRVADLWLNHLIAGERIELADCLANSMPCSHHDPVFLLNIGVHLVCPHHLTVAFGQAHVVYTPSDRIVGFGALSRLVDTATSRLTLQEEACNRIAGALVTHLGARAAVAVIAATHPCHNVMHPRSHDARAVTYGVCGRVVEARRLRREIAEAVGADGLTS